MARRRSLGKKRKSYRKTRNKKNRKTVRKTRRMRVGGWNSSYIPNLLGLDQRIEAYQKTPEYIAMKKKQSKEDDKIQAGWVEIRKN